RIPARGSAKLAVPTWTRDAPASRYCTASSPDRIRPTPRRGTSTRLRACQTAWTPIGSSAGPLVPPVPAPSTGRRVRTSNRRPGTVLISVSASATSPTATAAMAPMSGTLGASCTTSARDVARRAQRTASARRSSREQQIAPPALTLGQHPLSPHAANPSPPSTARTRSPNASRRRAELLGRAPRDVHEHTRASSPVSQPGQLLPPERLEPRVREAHGVQHAGGDLCHARRRVARARLRRHRLDRRAGEPIDVEDPVQLLPVAAGPAGEHDRVLERGAEKLLREVHGAPSAQRCSC